MVTGADGFIGSVLVRRLRESGMVVTALAGPGGASAVHCDACVDLTQGGALLPWLDSKTLVFHLAGSADVRHSMDNPADDFRANVFSTLLVLESIRRVGAALVYCSSAAVYDDTAALPWKEDSALSARSPYGAGKIAAEAYCRTYARVFDLDVRIGRIFSVYGEGMRRHAIRDFVERLAMDRKKLVVRGSGRQQRDYLHVDDVAAALICIATSGSPGAAYNIGAGVGVPIAELARRVATLADSHECAIVADGSVTAGDPEVMVANIDRLVSLGFRVEVSLEEGLERTVASLLGDQTQRGERA